MENKRQIKFRAWEDRTKTMHYDLSFYSDNGEAIMAKERPLINGILLQFTGKRCFNNREVYEGDILFYEEEGENGDERYYLVVTWIQEWCMFATLHVEEYHKYLTGGAKELDEVLYWTYPIEESEDYHYAGNIYQNPDLLSPKDSLPSS